jgi:hypothetical protein
VIDMVVDEPPLRLVDRLLNCMQLLGELKTAPTFIKHRDDASHVTLSTLEAFDDVWMRLMDVCVCHEFNAILSGRIGQARSGRRLKGI